MTTSCNTCKHAEWERGPRGGIARSLPGICSKLNQLTMAPASPGMVAVTMTPILIWYGDGAGCKTYEPK